MDIVTEPDQGAAQRSNRVVFLLGAGASYKAGVPLMAGFIEQFEQTLFESHPEVSVRMSPLISRLREHFGNGLDLEALLLAFSMIVHDEIFRGLAGGAELLGVSLEDVEV